eukprot:15289982-Heterocapsa_arctica.AAC.1
MKDTTQRSGAPAEVSRPSKLSRLRSAGERSWSCAAAGLTPRHGGESDRRPRRARRCGQRG